jgi:hypothetical protein
MLQQFTKVETADSAQALCQFCREEQHSSEPLRWITRANSPPLFFHEFLNSHRFPHSRYTPRLSRSSGEWGVSYRRFLAGCVLWRTGTRAALTAGRGRRESKLGAVAGQQLIRKAHEPTLRGGGRLLRSRENAFGAVAANHPLSFNERRLPENDPL